MRPAHGPEWAADPVQRKCISFQVRIAPGRLCPPPGSSFGVPAGANPFQDLLPVILHVAVLLFGNIFLFGITGRGQAANTGSEQNKF